MGQHSVGPQRFHACPQAKEGFASAFVKEIWQFPVRARDSNRRGGFLGVSELNRWKVQMDEVLVARGQNAMEWRPTSAGYSGKTARQC